MRNGTEVLGMAVYKVEICGVNTASLPVLGKTNVYCN